MYDVQKNYKKVKWFLSSDKSKEHAVLNLNFVVHGIIQM